MKAYGFSGFEGGKVHRFACCDMRNGCTDPKNTETGLRVTRERKRLARAGGKKEIRAAIRELA